MSPSSPSRATVVGYAATIFLSAFLLFQVQPLISKSILPWFGGTPSVWTTCMLFFQASLFGGYAYAHFLIQRVSPRGQLIVHTGIMLSALLVLPITPSSAWKPAADTEPTLRIVLLLAANVGLPFFVLSATGPLLQGWFGRATDGASPYRLYALSNVGSLLALVSYPFLLEPAFATPVQAGMWSWAFGAFTVFCAACGVRMCYGAKPRADETKANATTAVNAPDWGRRLLWFGLSMVASVMLLATTNQVCMDVAAVPFLWVLPLTLYLMSFILCFDSDRWYSRRSFGLALAVSFAGVCVVMLKGSGGSILAQVLVYMAGLFFCAMVCHGELVRLKPDPKYLTTFYLVIAAGGAGGGVFVGVVAPLIFAGYWELHLGLIGCCALTLLVFFRDRSWVLYAGRPRWAWAAMILGVIGMSMVLRVQANEAVDDAVAIKRSFYGVLKVKEADVGKPTHRFELYHGRIKHGQQFTDPKRRGEPTTYYGRQSGVGLLLGRPDRPGGQRIGVVGLGVGTLATYGKPGDVFRFYEINPEVTALAKAHFSFLRDTPAEVEVVTGDARLLLEEEEPNRFDLLVLDAFSGDAIPAHLLTVEALEIDLRHLKNDGVLAVHISNLHFDLEPVVAAAGERFGLHSAAITSKGSHAEGTEAALWMLLSRKKSVLEAPSLMKASHPVDERRILWTDQKSNLFEILR